MIDVMLKLDYLCYYIMSYYELFVSDVLRILLTGKVY